MRIASLPHCTLLIRASIAYVGDVKMGTNDNHRKFAEQCIAMARAADGDRDKALWLTLAQSWVRLAEHVARTGAEPAHAREDVADSRDIHSADDGDPARP
jgi:hypothetical protein